MMQMLSTRWPLRVRILKPNGGIAIPPPRPPKQLNYASHTAQTVATHEAVGERTCDDSLSPSCKYRTGLRFRRRDTPLAILPASGPTAYRKSSAKVPEGVAGSGPSLSKCRHCP